MSKTEKKERFGYHKVVRENSAKLKIGSIRNVPDITKSEFGEIAAWYLGPKGENSELLQTMVLQAVHKTVAYRKNFEPGDPPVITKEIQDSTAYKQSVRNMMSAYEDLLEFLQSYTTPYFSMRYQGHMLWDNTLPALCGYFATMLHNPNNVSIQASNATTPLEILVGWDLCGMVGFLAKDAPNRKYDPWAHITCDGSVANLEACWSARELKFYPFALRRMLEEAGYFSMSDNNDTRRQVPIDNINLPFMVRISDSEEIALTADNIDSWALMNLPIDEIVAWPGRIAELYGIEDEYVVWSASIPYTLNYLGTENMMQYLRTISADVRMPVLIVPSTMHYSLPKSAALLGYGFGTVHVDGSSESGGRIISVPVDEDGRMDMVVLERTLEYCLTQRIPIAQVIGVVGTTEEGAVDNISKIVHLRELFSERGLTYCIHADCAWGGYMITAMRKVYTFAETVNQPDTDTTCTPQDRENPFINDTLTPFSNHVYAQMAHIRYCDSVTIDPHKMGYVQYPAGAILYRNGIIRRLTTFTATYIGGTGSIDPGPEPSVGVYGIEGSRAGAASAAVFMSHRVIRPDVTGHGKIIRQCMENTKLFALYLMALSERSKDFKITLLCPSDILPEGMQPSHILSMESEEIRTLLRSDPFRHFGPDLNILNYVCNPHKDDGSINQDLHALNRFNMAVYEQCHVPVAKSAVRELPEPLNEFPKLFITMTKLHTAEYGGPFLTKHLSRILKSQYNENDISENGLVCLRSVIMDPFMPFAQSGDFFKTIASQLRSILNEQVEKWRGET